MPSHQHQPGLTEQSLHINAPGINANQALLGRTFLLTATKPHWVKLLHQRQPSLIKQGSPPKPTRPHWEELSYQCQPGLSEKSFHINANQALSGRAPHRRQPGHIRPSFAPMPIKTYWAALLCILDLKENQSYDLAHHIVLVLFEA